MTVRTFRLPVALLLGALCAGSPAAVRAEGGYGPPAGTPARAPYAAGWRPYDRPAPLRAAPPAYRPLATAPAYLPRHHAVPMYNEPPARAFTAW